MRRTLLALALALSVGAAPPPSYDCELPFGFPDGFTLFEDGSWRASDGTTGCLPTWACEED
jgi:hypothetical protein